MKLSHLFLLGGALLPFQTHAMEANDGREDRDNKIKIQTNFTPKTAPPNNKKGTSISLQTCIVDQLLSTSEGIKKKRKRKKKSPELINLPQQHAKGGIDDEEQSSSDQPSPILLAKSPLEETLPIVEKLIQKVVEEKREIPLKVNVPLEQANIESFNESFIALTHKYPFPFSWCLTNKGPSTLQNGQHAWIFELSLSSQANEREQVEKKFVYKISDLERQKVNLPNIYDVAMRSGLTLEDFKFNNSIKVRTIELKGKTEVEDIHTLQQFLEQTLPKDENPFHILNIVFNPVAKGHYRDMLDVFLRVVSEANVGYSTRGTVFDSENGQLYLCLDNTHRKILDLHGKDLPSGKYDGRSVKQAAAETQGFIMKAYEAFQEDVSVLTGRGNHVHANGQKGILKEAFEEWIKTEPFSTIIERSFPLEGEGGYKIWFKNIQYLNLVLEPSQNFIPLIKQTFDKMIQQKKTRLHVLLSLQENSSVYEREFNLITGVYSDLYDHNKELVKLITPLCFEATSGEMKIIFNKHHSRCSSSFTFSDSYKSKCVFGTIHKS